MEKRDLDDEIEELFDELGILPPLERRTAPETEEKEKTNEQT